MWWRPEPVRILRLLRYSLLMRDESLASLRKNGDLQKMLDLEREAEIGKALEESAALIRLLQGRMEQIRAAESLLVDALQQGRKVLTAGNGGSAAEAMHMAEELTGRFRGNRRSLPAVALNADGTLLTCIGNDFGFDAIFSRQVEGLGTEGDVLVLFSTSGMAANLSNAARAARGGGLKIIGILGPDGGRLAGCCDVEICVPGQRTERIQEAHQVILHILLDAIESAFG